MAMEELGPTFMKLGQILSTRADLVGTSLANELKMLQERAPEDPPEVVRRIVQDELGQPVDDLFVEFDDKLDRLGVNRPGSSSSGSEPVNWLL